MTSRIQVSLTVSVCLLSCAYAGIFRASLVPGGFTVLTGEEAVEVLNQCSHYAPQPQGLWQPSKAQIAELERRLPAWLARQSRRPWHKVRYFRQYVGVVHEGHRYIYLNAFPADSVRENVQLFAELKAKNHPALAGLPSYLANENYWREHAIVVCDGGDVYWGVEYDPITQKFMNLSENGIG